MNTSAVVTFGRFQPPTIGHEHLFHQMESISIAHGADSYVFVSQTVDAKSNPLAYKEKIGFLRAAFPNVNIVEDLTIKSPNDVLRWLTVVNYANVWMVAGADRLPKYKDFLKYIGPNASVDKRYGFEELILVPAGDRDPDSDDISGVSSTKARFYAKTGDLDSFSSLMPPSLDAQLIEKIYMDVRRGLKIS